MTTVNVDMVDVKRVIRELGKIDKELAKEFRAQANEIAKPAVEAARAAYRDVPLSGMARKWSTQSGRRLFPFDVNRAQRGVRLRVDTRRNAIGVLIVEQRDPAAAIFEAAGRRNDNSLDRSLDIVAGSRGWQEVPDKPTRLIGRAVSKAARQGVTDGLRRLILDVSRTVERRI